MRSYPGLLVILLVRLAAGATPATDVPHAFRVTTVSGVVHDSIARLPLVGAAVQLVDADSASRFGRTVLSDSLGRFAFGDVPDGRYMLGFFHAMLDSLGLEPILREVFVARQRPVRADLAIPAPQRLRSAICGRLTSPSSGAVLIGYVREARDRAPAVGVTVVGEWVEYSFGPGGLVRRVPKLVATTLDRGWFAMCNVPNAGTMTLMASRGADSTDVIELQVPAEGFVRRELYLGVARTVTVGDTSQSADTLAAAARRVHMGEGRLSGTVVATDGRPLAGAQVGIVNGPRTRANELGAWTLIDAPAGTRTLEVRAVGHYPERRAVDVVDGAMPVRISLATMKSVLDTMKVMATRMDDVDLKGFLQRSKIGIGRYMTAEDIARRRPMTMEDIFRTLPGFRVERQELGATAILIRGAVEDWCAPAIYLNGRHLDQVTADELDSWVSPINIAAMEVYTGISAPPEFQPGQTGCGSIVVWTKSRTVRKK